MCMGGGAPSPPAPIEPKDPPKRVSEATLRARSDEQKRVRNLQGSNSTFLTSKSGLMTEANTNKKTLLGG